MQDAVGGLRDKGDTAAAVATTTHDVAASLVPASPPVP